MTFKQKASFMHDNAPAHTTSATIKYFGKVGIVVLYMKHSVRLELSNIHWIKTQ